MRFKVYLHILLVMLISSCVEKEKKEVFAVKLLESPAGENSSLPYLFSNSETTLLSWVQKENDSLTHLYYSEFQDGVWQTANEIISGTDWFVNWADFPSIVENNGHLFSHILKKSSVGTYSYDVKMNLKSKNAKEWKLNIPLHTDGTPTEHGFVTALPFQEGTFFVTWLDGRNTEEKEDEERGAMTIRAAVVSPDGVVSNENLLDSRTCDCCQTTAAITTNGPVVIYRDRSENEIRDISIVRQIDGKWTAPKAVHNDDWKIKGCPVNGPKVAVIENTLAVAWFTAANEKPAVRIAFSHDGDANFDKPITIGTSDVIGRVDVALLDKETALVSYMESKDKSAQLKVAKINRLSGVSNERVIAEISSSRKTGFPQMELMGDKVLFAWTDVTDEKSTIKTAYVSAETLSN
mgnify:FL=1